MTVWCTGVGNGNAGKRGAERRAFSLLETLVAVAIFTIAIAAIIEGIAASTRIQISTESESRAAMLAQNVMEEIEYAGSLRLESDNGEFGGEDSRYSWATEVLQTDQEGLYEVRVVVGWTESGADRDFRLVTYLRKSDEETTSPL